MSNAVVKARELFSGDWENMSLEQRAAAVAYVYRHFDDQDKLSSARSFVASGDYDVYPGCLNMEQLGRQLVKSYKLDEKVMERNKAKGVRMPENLQRISNYIKYDVLAKGMAKEGLVEEVVFAEDGGEGFAGYVVWGPGFRSPERYLGLS